MTNKLFLFSQLYVYISNRYYQWFKLIDNYIRISYIGDPTYANVDVNNIDQEQCVYLHQYRKFFIERIVMIV